ncbi:carbohydrate ABC transporter permease [Pseudogracilibacillus auburnensis]|uniref:Carbohydrate ABC transporter membrane protein 2 (CUT1 family) n=1 Tax=Pseudogracilibacillus auburnensis TaxID=1494959 RepID=A0A2V3WAD5_9BACI|nr:carbohydrate ABC transporter permease [Pseudogracilibacillus auburnensis]PXW90104.1 carbohydrate ABC transporter membrane protein 2 (CUT1 family) [Pseudogracilibacillus auburnensis]
MKKKSNILHGFIYLALSLGLILNFAPLAWMVSTSLKKPNEIFRMPPQLIPETFQFSNYLKVFELVAFEKFYINSIIVTVLVTVITVIITSMAGFAFAKIDFPGRNFFFFLFLSSLMIPFHVIMVPLYRIVVSFGWVDTYAGLILPQISTAFGIFLMRQFMYSVPDSILEAAKIDGSSTFHTFRKIVIPIQKPALATVAIFTFNSSWNNLLWPLLVTNSENMRTLPVGLALFKSVRNIDWASVMAASVMTLVPVIIFFIFMQKQFIRGLTGGAVKE